MNTTSILRHINAVRCLRLLKRSKVMSRSDIARELGLTRTTVGYAIKVLIDGDLAHEPIIDAGAGESVDAGRIGRPSVGVSLNARGAYFVGLDISTTALTAVLIDFGMTVVAKFTDLIEPGLNDVAEIADRLASLANHAVKAAGKHRSRVRGIGVSIPGLVSRDGRVAIAPFLKWRDIDLRTLLTDRIGSDVPVRICNDAVAMASVICASSSDAEVSDLLLILMSEGIGSAIIREGRVQGGFNGYAGEIGQMVMAPHIAGSSSQTFQLLAGQRFFLPFLAKDRPIAEAVLDLAQQPSVPPDLVEPLEQWADRLAAGFLNAIWMVDPERIVIGGVLAPFYRHVAARVDAILSDGMGGLRPPPVFVSPYGAEGAAIGAAALIRESLFTLPELADVNAE